MRGVRGGPMYADEQASLGPAISQPAGPLRWIRSGPSTLIEGWLGS